VITLVGRRAERAALDQFVEALRAGESRALAVSGEAGVGKTALLEYLAEQAAECRVLRLLAGAVSMALGQYVSVSSQRDSEKSLLARGTARVAGDAGAELDELAAIYEAKGVSPETAAQVVAELTAP